MTSSVRGYLSELRKELHLDDSEEREILTEIRDHIQDSASDLMEEGLYPDDAFSGAVDELGGHGYVAGAFYQVHSRGSWYHTGLAVLPHILLSLLFALGLWTTPLWLAGMLAVAMVISLFGWRMGRPTWTYPWMGYCLVVPVVSWGLAMSAVGLGAWGVLTKGSLPLGVPIYIASFVYIAGSIWIVIRMVSRVARRDWVIASLMVLPVPFLTYWSFYFYTQPAPVSVQVQQFPGFETSAAVIFLLLAGATALFFRIGRRMLRVALLAITAPSVVVLAWLSYQGGPGFLAVFSLSAMTIPVLLGPALLDRGSSHTTDDSVLFEETG